MARERKLDVLLVEDNPGDARLFQEVLRERASAIVLHHVVDGIEAMAFLRREGGYANAPIPAVMILDLNLPRMDGRAVLREMRKVEPLSHLPVIVFTTSSADVDIAACKDLGANAFVVKPIDLDHFFATVSSLEDFWFETALLPGQTLEASA